MNKMCASNLTRMLMIKKNYLIHLAYAKINERKKTILEMSANGVFFLWILPENMHVHLVENGSIGT